MSANITLPIIASLLTIVTFCSCSVVSSQNSTDSRSSLALKSDNQSVESEVGRSSAEIQNNNGRTLTRLKKKLTGTHDVNFGFEIPLPEVIPDPYVKINHHLDYWPYNRIYKFSLFQVVNIVYKLGHYLFELSTLGLKVAWQLFDYFHMKKSFDQLNHHNPGWSLYDEHDDRQIRLLT